MRKTSLIALSLLTYSTFAFHPAMATNPSDMAEEHFKAIAAGNVASLSSHYDKSAVFQWIGGPLDGVYTGNEEIGALWTKFAKAQGALELDVLSISEDANPKGSTINAAVKFKGKKAIPVRYILVYRNGKVVNEVWQIAPELQAY